MINKQLYVGISGLAGSGKDTVGHMLVYILNNMNKPMNEVKRKFFNAYSEETRNITRHPRNSKVYSVAFADTLKNICASLFGIPIDYFYNHKDDGYVNISGSFEYTTDLSGTEDAEIVSARGYDVVVRSDDRYNPNYWMSFRELLVYIGTYISQERINYNTYVNNVRNSLKNNIDEGTEYVLFTDVRFDHEIDFVRRQNCGVTIYVQRHLSAAIDTRGMNEGEIKAADVIISEDYADYDFVVDNFGTMEDLFEQVYDLVHSETVFKNETIELSEDMYLRMTDEDTYDFVFDRGSLIAPYNNLNDYDEATFFSVKNSVIRVGETVQTKTGPAKVERLYYTDNKYKVDLE
jgi:dephospho-CoA kinase